MTEFLIHRFVRNKNPKSDASRDQYGSLASIVGIAVNLLLFLGKLLSGTLLNSISVIADAFNNLSDMASSIITLLGFKLGRKPADEDHPYGHGRIEYFSGLLVSILVLYVGIQFLISSIQRILNPSPLDFQWLPVILMAISILAKMWISRFNQTLGDRINSGALKASALDARGDVMISTTVLAGLFIGKLTGLAVDGYIGLFVALMIIKSAWDLIRETLDPLLGSPPDPDLLAAMEEKLLTHPEIFGVHDTLAHNYGPNTIFASTHAEVRDDIPITRIHDIIDDLEKSVHQELGIELVIHMDPVHHSNEATVAVIKALRSELLKLPQVKDIHDIRLRDDRFIAEIAIPAKSDLAAAQTQACALVRAKGYEPELIVHYDNILVQGDCQ